ncbi:MAG: branched-chain amino acid ABC transporter permease [candidate division WOR-3 bacterium]
MTSKFRIKRPIRKIKTILFILLLYIIIQLLMSFDIINPYFQKIICYAGIMIISALGLNLIYGFTGQFSLGHAAFFGIGAYASALITRLININHSLILLVGLFIAAGLSGIIAFVIGLPILRLRSDYLGIATLGFGIIVKVLFDNADAVIPILGGSRGMLGILPLTNFSWVYLFTILSIIFLFNLINSAIGRALISVREDEIAAEAVGVNTTKYKTLGFVIGSIYAGIAGGLYAHLYAFLHPSNFDFLKSIDVLLIVVLGGMASISGSIVAATLWVFLLEGLRVILPEAILDWRLVIYPLLLILIMIFRPEGIFGKREFKFLIYQEKSNVQ